MYDTFAPCAVLVSELLNLPNVVIAIAPPNYAFSIYHMVPMPLSYIPVRETGFPGNMTFIQRVMNVGLYCLQHVLLEILFVRSLDGLKIKYNITTRRGFKEGYGAAELVIFLADFAMENPQPLLPGWFCFASQAPYATKNTGRQSQLKTNSNFVGLIFHIDAKRTCMYITPFNLLLIQVVSRTESVGTAFAVSM